MTDPSSRLAFPPNCLHGQTVLITRPAGQAEALARQFVRLGAETLIQPVIRIEPSDPDTGDADSIHSVGTQLKQGQSDFGCLIVASKNGVDHLFAAWQSLDIPTDRFDSLQWIAIGPGTAKHLATALCNATGRDTTKWRDRIGVPPQSNSESLAAWLIDRLQTPSNPTTSSRPVLIIRGDRGSNTLASRLAQKNIAFTEIVVYRSVDCHDITDGINVALQAGEVDWVTLTSSAIARSAARLFHPWLSSPGCHLRAVSISPKTTAAFQACGFEVAAEATRYSLEGVVAAVVAQTREED